VPGLEILLLGGGEVVAADPEGGQLLAGDPLLDLGRYRVDARREGSVAVASRSTARAWVAKVRSMTSAGWASAQLCPTRRPSASTTIRLPPGRV
jgi:hypothetical protein